MNEYLADTGAFTVRVMGMKQRAALIFRRSSAFIGGQLIF
jgi:hypothetical protein